MKNEKDSVPRLVSDTQKLLQDFTEREAGGIHSKAAKLLDVSGTTFSQWLHGTRVPSLSQIAPVYERLGVDLDVLASKSLTEFEAKYASIPQVKATAGAGASLEVDDTVTGYHIFSRAFLQSVGVNPNHAVIFPVAGDSMEPLILNGDFVLVDLATQEPEDGKIFVVAFDDHREKLLDLFLLLSKLFLQRLIEGVENESARSK